jgi:hypothetical protein
LLFFPTVDEDFQYFRSQGYSGSLNDMHYKAMGDLGYTGSLSDRIHAFLTFKYGSFYEAMRDLRNGTSIFSLISAYAVNNFDPSLVFDFEQNYYRTGGEDSTLSSSVTHAATSNATMTDSDGNIKWRPHSLLTDNSEDASTWNNKSAGTVSSYSGTLPTGYTAASTFSKTIGYNRPYTTISADGASTLRTFKVLAKYASAQFVQISQAGGTGDSTVNYDLVNGTVTSTGVDVLSTSITLISDGWYQLEYVGPTNTTTDIHFGPCGTGTSNRLSTYTTTVASEVHVTGAHAYRSDLGGMVNNPTTASSYVPTTSSAVYLPRVGHHIYNGNAWVNEGVLHESEARTNLVTYSEDFSQWLKGGNTTVTAGFSSPDGGSNAYRVEMPQGSGTFLRLASTLVSGSEYKFSIYVKDNGTGSQFTLHDGINSTPLISATDEWVRYSITFTAPSNTVYASIDNGSHSSGTDLLIYGAQVELGSTPSSYIPTSGSTVTRAAETLTVPAANLPYDSTNMSFQMDGRMTYADNNSSTANSDVGGEVTFVRWKLNNVNWLGSMVNAKSPKVGQVNFRQYGSGALDLTQTADDYYNYANNPVSFNIASRHGSTFINGAVDGTALTANTTPVALPDLSTRDLQLGYDFMGTIGKFRMWSDDLTDTGIATASAPSTEPSLQLTFDGSSTSSFKVLDWSE